MAKLVFDASRGGSCSLTSPRMKVLPTRLDGLRLLAPQVHGDERGFFHEAWRADSYAAAGVDADFVQDNHSRSRRGALRGIHFQTRPGQAKLVSCVHGAIFDVAVDLRRGSPTFGRWEGFELDDRDARQLFLPVGFGHGFCVLSESADVVYKVSSYYDPATELGIRFDDPEVGVRWPTGLELVFSERDATAPELSAVADELPFVYAPG